MRKKRNDRIYVKDKTNRRFYGDFRDLNGRCEALKDNGRATTYRDVAVILVAKRVKELEEEKRGIAIIGRGREETLEGYALHHLKRKEALKEVSDTRGEQRQLERAVDFFGRTKTLTAIDVRAVQDWVEDLRVNNKGRRGNETLSTTSENRLGGGCHSRRYD
jgi:ABC-type phosphate transport system auxiliary subunit